LAHLAMFLPKRKDFVRENHAALEGMVQSVVNFSRSGGLRVADVFPDGPRLFSRKRDVCLTREEYAAFGVTIHGFGNASALRLHG